MFTNLTAATLAALGAPPPTAGTPGTATFAHLAQMAPRAFSADEVLSPYVFVFYASFLVAFLFTPVMRAVAIFYGIIDLPDRVRKMHTTPVAYLGGVAVFLGWISGLAVSQFLHLHRMQPGWKIGYPVVNFGIVIAALVILVLGLWDDLLGIRPVVKICGQVIAAVCLLRGDVGTQCSEQVLTTLVRYVCAAMHRDDVVAAGAQPEWFRSLVLITSGLLVVLVIVGCCNATNLMDGLDGLCGGVTAIIVAGFLFVAVHLAMFGGGINTNWDALRVILGLALLGAVLGFIPYNFNPASIFMGDTGSMFLGFCCGTMIILMAQAQSKWFLASMVMFALPVLDTSLAFARRWIARRPLFSADAQHFHHQLVQRGYTVRQTVMICYGLAVGFALLGAAIVFMRTRYAVAFYLVTFGSIIVAAYKMGMVHERPAGGMPSTLRDGPPTAAGNVAIDPADVFEIPDSAGGQGSHGDHGNASPGGAGTPAGYAAGNGAPGNGAAGTTPRPPEVVPGPTLNAVTLPGRPPGREGAPASPARIVLPPERGPAGRSIS